MKKALITQRPLSLRFLLTLSLACIVSSISLAQQADKKPLKVYLMVGQSNMLGYGHVEHNKTILVNSLRYLVENDANKKFQFLVNKDSSWRERTDVWIHTDLGAGKVKYSGLKPGYGSSSGYIGPELGFGHKMGDAYEGQVLIIKTSWGGKSLGHNFLPPSIGKYAMPTTAKHPGFYYHEILRNVKDVTENIKTYFPDYQGQGIEFAGLCFHQGWNDQYSGLDEKYEENMVAFINDIRSAEHGIGVPNLPVVIATSGMITKDSLIKTAQKSMVDSVKYPKFKGNVAVVDTSLPYGGQKLQFMFEAKDSPRNQVFHWNGNARTHLNIGAAMAEEMPRLDTPVLPARLEAYGVPEGVQLTWQKGTEAPKSIKLLRNGKSMEAKISSSQTSFVDTTALPGANEYQLIIEMPTSPTQKLTATSDTSIPKLMASRSAEGVMLNWNVRGKFEGFKISRNGKVIKENFSADARIYQDTQAPKEGSVHYSIQPTTGKVTPASVTVDLGPHNAGGALIYEPFDYPTNKALIENQGAVGTKGKWRATAAKSSLGVTHQGLSFGKLPVAGNRLASKQSGKNNEIHLGTTLADAKLLTDGATLWFSLLVKPLESSNVGGLLYLGNSKEQDSGVGFDIGNTKLHYWTKTSGKEVKNLCSKGGLSPLNTQLLVGKLTWGADGADDTFVMYLPEPDLNLGEPTRSATPFNVDQSTLDQLVIKTRNAMTFDEIRFGPTYESVIGGGKEVK